MSERGEDDAQPVPEPESEPAGTDLDQPEPAAERDPIPPAGQPTEPTSDTQGTGADSPAPQQEPPADSAPADASAGPSEGDPGATTPEQPEGDLAVPGEGAAAEVAAESKDEVPVAEEAEEVPPPFDELRSPMVELLRERLGDAVVADHVEPGTDVWVRVRADAWADAAQVCRDDLGLTYFCFLSAVDWLPSPYGTGQEGDSEPAPPPASSAELAHGTTGGDTRFQLLGRLQAPRAGSPGLTLKADLPDDDLRAPTWSQVYPGADWHEREAWDMFGIRFDGHPHLANIYLPGDFEGHPLRKDFPLLSRMVKPWPGLVDVEPMPGEEPEDAEAAAE